LNIRLLVRIGLILVVASLLLVPTVTRAQTDGAVENFELALWPEYDRMGVLTIYKVRLASEVALPARISLPIPAAVGKPHAVAAWFEDGRLDDNVTWTQEARGDWSYITVDTPASGIWLEYYGALEVSGDRKTHLFTWPGGLAVDAFRFEVLHPVGASDLTISPETAPGSTGDDRPVSIGELGALGLEDGFTVELSYMKPSSAVLSLPGGLVGNTGFQQMNVDLLPEFDRPSMLLIYHGLLPESAALPVDVQLPIPASYGEPTAVALQDAQGNLLNVEYESSFDGDWRIVSFEAGVPAIWVEVYADLVMDGELRSFSLQWPPGPAVGSFGYEVQQPAGASGMRVSPGGAVTVGEDGMVYHSADAGPLSAGIPFMITVEYEKSDNALTQPSLERPAETQGGTPDPMRWIPYLLGALGVGLVAAGVLFYLRSRRGKAEKAAPPRKRNRQRKPRADESVEEDASPVFCHICGTRSAVSDRFCRQCGTQLRTGP
jgi:hypothetical protein